MEGLQRGSVVCLSHYPLLVYKSTVLAGLYTFAPEYSSTADSPRALCQSRTRCLGHGEFNIGMAVAFAPVIVPWGAFLIDGGYPFS